MTNKKSILLTLEVTFEEDLNPLEVEAVVEDIIDCILELDPVDTVRELAEE